MTCNTDPTVGVTFSLGCVGDGRPTASSTMCDKKAYTYFTVNMTLSTDMDPPTRGTIGDCRLHITNAKGKELASLDLSLVTDVTGSTYGCAPGVTKNYLGSLNYSSCVAGDETLTFTLSASTDAGAGSILIAKGAASGKALPGSVVYVDVKAAKI